ncbi:MAG TPA: MFS transporter [Candidatus Limnocylindrales bacterium]|nr:MFS transporter [Candidatus Limnocylindrales bacterium]
MLFSFLTFTAGTIFSLVFNLYMSALGFRNDVIGIFNALPAVGLIAVGLPVAALADRIGYRVFVLGSSGVATLAAIVLASCGARLAAVLAAGTFALGLTVLQLLGVPLLAQLSSPSERVLLFSVNEALAWAGTLLGNLIGGALPEAAARVTHEPAASTSSLRAAFVATAALLLIALPIGVRLSAAGGLRPSEVFPLRDMVRVDLGRFARLLGPQLLLGLAAGMLLNFIQLFLAQRFHLGPGPIGLVLAGVAALTAATSLIAPAVSRLLGLPRAIGIAQVLGFPLVLGLAFAMNLPLAVAILALRQVILNLQSPLVLAFGMSYVEARQRARLAIAQEVAFGIGFGGIGPLLSGVLQVRGGYQLAFSVSAAFYLLAGLSFLAIFGRAQPARRA